MIIETIYHESDLTYGICESCGTETDEIVIDDGRCVDCIESIRFYNEVMKNV